MTTPSTVEASVTTPPEARCTVVYGGEFWKPAQCREIAGHDQVEHVDRYMWSGVEYADQHAPHSHHVDGFGRTWR